jgi:hypothetical protein
LAILPPVSVYSVFKERYEKITDSKFFEGQFSLAGKIKAHPANTIVGARCVLDDVNFDEVYLIYCKAIESGEESYENSVHLSFFTYFFLRAFD